MQLQLSMWGGATEYVPLQRPCYALNFQAWRQLLCSHSSCTCMGSGSRAPCHNLTFFARLEPRLGDWDSETNATGTACEVGCSRLITSPHASFLSHRGLSEPWYATSLRPYVSPSLRPRGLCSRAPGPRQPGQQLHERLPRGISPALLPTKPANWAGLLSTCLSFGLKSRALVHPRRIGPR